MVLSKVNLEDVYLASIAGGVCSLAHITGACIVIWSRVRGKQVSEYGMASILALSGGLLYGAVSLDIIPEIQHVLQDHTWENVAMTMVGYILGIGFMQVVNLLIAKFQPVSVDEMIEEAERRSEQNRNPPPKHGNKTWDSFRMSHSTLSTLTKTRRSKHISAISGAFSMAESVGGMSRLGQALIQQDLSGPVGPERTNIALVLASCVDCLIEGIFIGSLMHTNKMAAWVFAGATAVESVFVAITVVLQCMPTVSGYTWGIALPASTLAIASFGGAYMVPVFDAVKPLYLFVLAFGMSAILYMVGRELLQEAFEHANTEKPKYFLPVAAYVLFGFGCVFAVSQAIPHGDSGGSHAPSSHLTSL